MWQTMEAALQLLSGALAPVIAIVTAYIAIQQYRTNRRKTQSDIRFAQSKQRFDLYERRLSIFNVVVVFIGSAITGDSADETEPIDQLVALSRVRSEGYFLFGNEILDYLQLLSDKYIRLSYLNRATNSQFKSEDQHIIDEAVELNAWFVEQFDEARKKFAKYLSLQELDGPVPEKTSLPAERRHWTLTKRKKCKLGSENGRVPGTCASTGTFCLRAWASCEV